MTASVPATLSPALYYETLPDRTVRCTLCPHDCQIALGHRGACGVRLNHEGHLFTMVGDRIVAAEVDPVEKKPLFHYLPGSLAYSIATVGCNFRCQFCQNWMISQSPKLQRRTPQSAQVTEAAEGRLPHESCSLEDSAVKSGSVGEPVLPSELVKRAQRSRSASIAYTYTEPTIFFELALATARMASAAGLGNVLVTNGFIALAPLREIAPYVSAANIDFKSYRDSFYKKICGGRLHPVLTAIQEYKRLGVWIELTTLVIPGLNDDTEELRDMAGFIRQELGEDVPWHLSRYFPAYKMERGPVTPIGTLRHAREIARQAGLRYVYLGNVPEEEGAEDTYCPRCGAAVIQRMGVALVGNRLQGGRCPGCMELVTGRWAIGA